MSHFLLIKYIKKYISSHSFSYFLQFPNCQYLYVTNFSVAMYEIQNSSNTALSSSKGGLVEKKSVTKYKKYRRGRRKYDGRTGRIGFLILLHSFLSLRRWRSEISARVLPAEPLSISLTRGEDFIEPVNFS